MRVVMFSRVRRRLTYANVVMTLALVFAMSGGAYAAKHYLITSTKQISPKVLRALKGKAGPAGPAGVQGLAGAPGAVGKEGAPGAVGKEGAPGIAGSNGVSPTSKQLATTEAACNKEGGSEFTAAENKKTTACNGKEGSPWTAGGTLPKGAVETGQWAAGEGLHVKNQSQFFFEAVSFPIRLAKELEEPAVHFIAPGTLEENDPAGCKGTAAAPSALAGNLCVFETEATPNLSTPPGFVNAQNPAVNASGAGTTGTLMEFKVDATSEEPFAIAVGTWAVAGN